MFRITLQPSLPFSECGRHSLSSPAICLIIKGLIEAVSDAFINLVNADYVAKQRGLRISEERQSADDAVDVPLETISVSYFFISNHFKLLWALYQTPIFECFTRVVKIGLFEWSLEPLMFTCCIFLVPCR